MKRRAVLTIAMIVLVALAGCTGALPGSDDPTESEGLVQYVPADAEVVVGAEMTVAEDDESATLVEEIAGPVLGAGETNPDEALDQFEEETGLDPAEVEGVIGYAVEEEPVIIVQTGWSEEEIVETIEEEDDVEYEASEHAGITIYEPAEETPGQEGALAVLADGVYAAGQPELVRSTAEVAGGEADALDGQMRSAYDDASGAVVGALVVEEEDIPAEGPSPEVDPAPLSDVDVIGFGYDTGDGTVSLEATLYTASDDAASEITEVVEAAFGFAAENAPDETLADEFRSVEVSQDGDRVTISYEGEVDTLEEIEVV